MNTYFYIRVSTKEQNTVRQEVKAKEHNIPIANVYIEKASGKNVTDRPVLAELMNKLSNGDKVIVDSISRFARNTRDLLDLVDELNKKGVTFVSLKESIDTTTPTGMFMLTIFGAVAQLERDYLKERQAEGIEVAKAEGKYKGRKPIEYPKQWDKYYKMYKDGAIKAVDMMRILKLKKTTFYKLINQYEEKMEKKSAPKKSNEDIVTAEVEKLGYELSSCDSLINKLSKKELSKVIDVLDQEYTDVDVIINKKEYVVEITTVDDEKDLNVITKLEYISRYSDERYDD